MHALTRNMYPILVAVVIGYVALLAASLIYLTSPWNFVVAGLILFKGLIFGWALTRATSMGRKQVPPRP